jgi:hypothetical protein
MRPTDDQTTILGLWASSAGPVLWVRPARGHSVYVSISPERNAQALELRIGSRDNRTVVGRWDDYDQELRVPLPRLPHNAELIVSVEYRGTSAEPWLSPGLSIDRAAGAQHLDAPKWLLPEPGYQRVPATEWSTYAITRADDE